MQQTSLGTRNNVIQVLLDTQAELANQKFQVEKEIRKLRGVVPPECFGMDDCSSMFLSVCPWRFDCGVYKND